MLYKNCRELPIHNFNEIVLTSDFSYLIKEGKATDKDLFDRWLNILDEYVKISGDSAIINRETKRFEREALRMQLNTLNLIKMGFIDGLELLELWGVKDVEKQIRKLKIRIAVLEDKPTEDTDTMGFEKNLVELSKTYGKIDRFTTTVSEWLTYLNNAKESARKQKR